jgi:hypothetical protein
MGTTAFARINTTQQWLLYRDFVIQETIEGWEWTHQDYDRLTFPITGDCQTLFECIDAVEAWHDEQGTSDPVIAAMFADCKGASLGAAS